MIPKNMFLKFWGVTFWIMILSSASILCSAGGSAIWKFLAFSKDSAGVTKDH